MIILLHIVCIVSITSPELQPMAVQYAGHMIQTEITWPVIRRKCTRRNVTEPFNTTTFIQNCIYMKFRINLTQFYINFLRKEHQIDVLYVSFNVWDSQVSFFLYVPFKVLCKPFLKGLLALTNLYAKLTMLNSQWYSKKLCLIEHDYRNQCLKFLKIIIFP